ncbi:Uncharacterised protein [Mycobacterium tuberculosis]|nr:Uncharacterised protein [Mycobacterium tuberculosis]
MSAVLALSAAVSARRAKAAEAHSAPSSNGTPASAATPSCQEIGNRASAITAGSRIALVNGVTRLTTRPTSSGPVAAIACRAVAVFSAVNQSNRTTGSRSATSCWVWLRTAKPSSIPMRAVTASSPHPATVAADSQPSHSHARCGASPNNAAISGTSNTVPTARATTEQNASSAKPISLARWSFGTRAIQVRIIGCRPALRRPPPGCPGRCPTAGSSVRPRQATPRGCRVRRSDHDRARRSGRPG